MRGIEKKVMMLLWEHGPLTRQEIVDGCDLTGRSAYTALRRLEDKGFIRCKHGRRWVNNASYEVLKTREDLVVSVIREYKPDMIKVIELLGKKK